MSVIIQPLDLFMVTGCLISFSNVIPQLCRFLVITEETCLNEETNRRLSFLSAY